MFKMFKTVWNNKMGLPALPPPNTFKDQTILIAGASGGIGLATAVHFVNLGASTVIITARTSSKGETAKVAIELQTNSQGKDIVKVMELDMSTFAGVQKFAEKVKNEVKQIDYVCLNAGTLNRGFKVGGEGFEETIQVNALSTGLLAILLLPWMKVAGGGKAHLSFVTSGLHRGVDISPGKFPQTNIFTHFSKPENWPKSSGLYATSKFLEQCIVFEISKLALDPDGRPQVIVNPLCPGMVKSDLGRDYFSIPLVSVVVPLFNTLMAKSTEGGARTLVLAGNTKSEEHGKHISFYQSDEEYKATTEKNIWGPEGQNMQKEVWKEVVQILGERVAEVKELKI